MRNCKQNSRSNFGIRQNLSVWSIAYIWDKAWITKANRKAQHRQFFHKLHITHRFSSAGYLSLMLRKQKADLDQMRFCYFIYLELHVKKSPGWSRKETESRGTILESRSLIKSLHMAKQIPTHSSNSGLLALPFSFLQFRIKNRI